MILNKADLDEYKEKDKKALGIMKKHPSLIGDTVWKFEIALRYHEYYKNTRPKSLKCTLWKCFHYLYGLILGFSIPCNVFMGGLRINHYRLIVVNGEARVGEWCDIHQGVNIGVDFEGLTPKLGNNVWIGPGARYMEGLK